MSKEIYISSTPHETRLAIVEKDELSEIYYERENEYTLAGSIYNGRVTRVLPGMQSAFVDVGLERDAFLYITDFLEEQGESADFEAGGESRRPSGQMGGGERSGGERAGSERSGGERSSGERSSGERGRGDRDRGERGDRDRGGRDRGGNGREQVREAVPEAARSVEPISVTPDPERSSEHGAESGEEGTAEGSRVWRGRRGRRRGRGGEPRAAAPGSENVALPAEDNEVFAEEAETSAPVEQIHGRAEEPDASAREDRPREDRPREDRGGRGGRDRDRGERGGRGRERFAGRDRGPRREASGGENAGAPETGPAVEPLILPGESLSKYRRGEDGGAEASVSLKSKPQANLIVARPSTELDLTTAGWDGGAVLPGETLSRHRARGNEAPAASVGRAETHEVYREEIVGEPAGDGGETGRNRRRDRDARRGRGGRPEQTGKPSQEAAAEEPTPTSFHSGVTRRESLDPSEAVQPGVTSQHEPEGTTVRLESGFSGPVGGSDDAPAFETAAFETRQDAEMSLAEDVEYVPETDYVSEAEGVSAPSAGPSEALLEAVQQMHETVAASAEPAVHAVEEFHEETLEYEPGEDASASYRVDPAGPSEFRQGSLVEDELNLVDVRFEEGSEVSQEGAGREFTAIQASGEMLSELPGEVTVPGAEEDPSNPIEHETAVQSMHLSDVEGTPQPTAAPAQAAVPEESQAASAIPSVAATSTLGFAPGDGQLEEELLDDDDDGELFSMSAAGDDTEEEVLEAGDEIGSLARDRALDHITHSDVTLASEDLEDDEFDIDEEDLEEDELDGSEEIAGGEFEEDEEEDDRLEIGDAPFEEEDGGKPAAAAMGEFPEFSEEGAAREPGRGRGGEARGGEGQGRREGRRGEGRDRGGRGGRGGRDSRGMANSRTNGGGTRNGRHSVQNSDMPAISDLLKPGQEVLVQIAKEPIAKKGARITSHIALPGRFLVFMPTVNHVGVSRKIESDGERRRLKEVLLSEKGEAAGGFIVRTAALGASEEELRSDLRFLLNLWADIKQRSEASKSPALIYHDLNLVERILRDQVTDNFSAIWVDTETEYERVLRFLQRFQPALMRRVKLYTKDTPLFEQFGISEEINKALRSKVWLKSGGSIVINQTEALVAIDINTGKFVGKTARLEDTIVKTNLDAIPEIVRQIRLRDLGGIIVIDFIDMDDRKNRARVLAALEDELKNDRAPSKVLQFNDFGLVAITRKRVKQSLERTLSTTCAICAGTGMTKSPVTVCNEIYIELRKMHKQLDKGDVMLRVNPEVVKQLKSGSGKWLQEMEEISGKTILVKSDPSLHPEQFDIH